MANIAKECLSSYLDQLRDTVFYDGEACRDCPHQRVEEGVDPGPPVAGGMARVAMCDRWCALIDDGKPALECPEVWNAVTACTAPRPRYAR